MHSKLLLAASAVFAVTISPLPASAQGFTYKPAYRCTVMSMENLGSNGKLAETDFTRTLRRVSPTFTFDSASGILRWQGREVAWQYEVVQHGSDANDLVATRRYQGAAAYIADLLRIRPWEPTIPFLLVETADVITGTCEAL